MYILTNVRLKVKRTFVRICISILFFSIFL